MTFFTKQKPTESLADQIAKIEVGGKVKFTNDRAVFNVEARNDKFIILTMIERGKSYHTIMDIELGKRGKDNMIFHSGYDGREECEERLKEFTDGQLKVSHRNNVPTIIKWVKNAEGKVL